MQRVLIVGEYNPHSRDDRHALLPSPAGAAGDRLRRIFGMTPQEYLRTFDRANLLASPGWSAKLARASAERLPHRRRILLGAKVSRAHEVSFDPFKTFTLYDISADGRPYVRVLVLPHPSGRCRIWNDRQNVARARRAVRRFLRGAA